VYIDEVSLFPPSVAQVETAIPAFIGYSRQAIKDGSSILNVPTRIKSMLEFRKYFGEAPDRNITVTLDAFNAVDKAEIASKWYLYDSLQMFFANGGEKCYIVSVGDFSAALSQTHFTDALKTLKQYDEPTLIVMPDLMLLAKTTPPSTPEKAAIAAVQQAAIDHAAVMQDRFAVLDVLIQDGTKNTIEPTDIANLRNSVSNSLKYGAAYYPWLTTSLPVTVGFNTLTIKRKGGATINLEDLIADAALKAKSVEAKKMVADIATVKALLPDATVTSFYEQPDSDIGKTAKQGVLNTAVTAFATGGSLSLTSTAGAALLTDYRTITVIAVAADPTAIPPIVAVVGVVATANGQKFEAVKTAAAALSNANTLAEHNAVLVSLQKLLSGFNTELENRIAAIHTELISQSALYGTIVNAASSTSIVLPPSGAVVGIYAAVDSTRGVWKAPANVGVSNVIGPTVMMNDADQGEINVDVTAGKSINAIRSFTGKGTLIWGARTLAGNDNEWRYVPVRRFFNMVEESVKKASGQFVFEPNDANTWVKVRAMIENFLTLQWRAGALAGAKPEHAFFVRVGIGQTMTAEDILNGIMIVEIGMAVVRPAEFIVLRFSHKMQES
jgi:hypothetical protein